MSDITDAGPRTVPPSAEGFQPAGSPPTDDSAAREPAQSEVIGTLLFTAVVILLIGLIGLFVLSGIDTSADPAVDLEVTANGTVVNLIHVGGDRLADADVRVIFGQGGTGSEGLENFTELAGDGDGAFEGSERRTTAHGATGLLSVTVVHEPTNTVLVREFIDVAGTPSPIPTSTPISTPTGTPTTTPTGTATPTSTPVPPPPWSATWETAADWDAATAESGVVHESFGDHAGDRVALGYASADAGLVGYWPFDEDAGGTAVDAAGGNDGTIQGDPALGGEGIGKSSGYGLDGDGDYVTVPDASGLEMSDGDAVTVSTWVRKDAAQSGWIAIFQKSDQSYNLQLQDGEEPAFTIYDGSWNTAYSGLTASTGQWYHVVGTFNGSDVSVYVDGTLEGTASATEISDGGGFDVGVGENLDAPNRELDGRIDEVRLYDRALSPAEVGALHDAATTGSLTTAARSGPSNVGVGGLELSDVEVTRPSEVTVTVESDPDGDGTFEEASDPIALDGSGTHAVSGLSTPSARFRLRIEFASPDVTASPTFGGAVLRESD